MTYRAKCTGKRLRKRDAWLRLYLKAYRRHKKLSELGWMAVYPEFFEEYVAHGIQSGEGWHGTIGGACPVQGEGECDGVPWYFRARHTGWSIEFGLCEDANGEQHGVATFERGGTHGITHESSWMRARHAWSIIKRSIAEFRQCQHRQNVKAKQG